MLTSRTITGFRCEIASSFTQLPDIILILYHTGIEKKRDIHKEKEYQSCFATLQSTHFNGITPDVLVVTFDTLGYTETEQRKLIESRSFMSEEFLLVDVTVQHFKLVFGIKSTERHNKLINKSLNTGLYLQTDSEFTG